MGATRALSRVAVGSGRRGITAATHEPSAARPSLETEVSEVGRAALASSVKRRTLPLSLVIPNETTAAAP